MDFASVRGVRNGGRHVVGILHPGNFGAPFGASLRIAGHTVLWCGAGRSAASRERAERAGLVDVGSMVRLCERSELIISLCPSNAAIPVAKSIVGFSGTFVEANAIAPARTREIAAFLGAGGATVVDGAVLGPPPGAEDELRNYRFLLAGPKTDVIADVVADTPLTPIAVGDELGAASAIKLCWSSWMKGTSSLLLAIREAAAHYGVEDTLLAEWTHGMPDLVARSDEARRTAARKGGRWPAELNEIAEMFDGAGIPGDFQRGFARYLATRETGETCH